MKVKKEKNKKPDVNKKIIQLDKDSPKPLVPAWMLLPLWFISLAMPNLIYSGINFADTLHILKWAVTGVPVAVALFIAGLRLVIYGSKRIKIKFDIFALIWALILIYCLAQPLWVNIKSPTGYALEMTCFATVWMFYVLTISSLPDWSIRPIIILGNINAAINIVYAELQSRHMSNFEFMRGTIFENLIQYSNIILPVPGNYIGNTAQQNMFGLWVAISLLGAIYLFVYDAWLTDSEESGKKVWFPVLILILAVIGIKFYVVDGVAIAGILAFVFVLLAFFVEYKLGAGTGRKHLYLAVLALLFAGWDSWGLINSTSRSAILALLTGLVILFVAAVCKFKKHYVIRFAAVMALIAVIFTVFTLYNGPKAQSVIHKTKDIIQNYQSIGLRRGIWATSYGMLHANPQGVGIGQYKWHYMDGQREAFKIFEDAPWMTWQYTHWAHNEFLQFFCEGGYIGGILFLLMYSFWFFPALVGLKRKTEINIHAIWAFALVSLITFAAVFTRPFHRIENMVWITLGFAVSNREFFPALNFKTEFNILKSNILSRLAGIIFVGASITGCLFISSGIYGNYLLRQALTTQSANVQLYYLEQAAKHPIVYEDTMRNLAHHYMQVGEQANSIELIANGFNILWAQFHREPRSEDIGTILTLAQRFQLEPVLREMKTFFKPGTYHLQRVPQVNAATGEKIDALLLLNGPGSDDD